MNEVVVRQETLPEAGEVKALARELAAAYRDRVLRYKHELGLSTEEAAAKAGEPPSMSERFRVMDRPAEEPIPGPPSERGHHHRQAGLLADHRRVGPDAATRARAQPQPAGRSCQVYP